MSAGLVPVNGGAPWVNSRGQEFYQFFQHFPASEALYLDFEKNYDPFPGFQFVYDHQILPLAIVTGYMLFVYFGRIAMKHRDPADLRNIMAAWNAMLCVFSLWGSFRTAPHLLFRLTNETFRQTLCEDASTLWGSGATGFWVQLFIYSKVIELGDTFFLVARKKKVMFLHWFHHVTVLLYCWYAYAYETSQAQYFVAMNFSVHGVMYGYYCLMALKLPSFIPSFAITVSQISQMVVGTLVQVFAFYYQFTATDPSSCNVHLPSTLGGLAMYAWYFLLFFQFALDRYFFKPRAAKAKAKRQD